MRHVTKDKPVYVYYSGVQYHVTKNFGGILTLN